ncbi:hypothetical protein [Adlercreutzia caecimuris]|uniref:hypothetical protein n=1 Tax=Adlercreutzia caecimuris TaxID=671266 RepID=UPI00272DB73E|nr:hypothetical protein [Adlercreutzia caecimuris]
MASAYTKDQILAKCDEAAKDMNTFYKQPFVNYRGKTSDTDELITEVVAKWCLDNLSKFDEIQHITRAHDSYNQHHTGETERDVSCRNEERIAMELFNQSKKISGGSTVLRIIDYQTPLKHKRDDHAGKIDLLGYDGDVLVILELKDEDSEETMLRCVLEGYTYLKTVDHEKLIADFAGELGSEPKGVEACPLVFMDGYQAHSMGQDTPNLNELISVMTGGVYYLSKMKPYRILLG